MTNLHACLVIAAYAVLIASAVRTLSRLVAHPARRPPEAEAGRTQCDQ